MKWKVRMLEVPDGLGGVGPFVIENQEGEVVCSMPWPPDDLEKVEKNSQLISMVPQLVETLVQVLDAWQYGSSINEEHSLYNSASELVAKAVKQCRHQ